MTSGLARTAIAIAAAAQAWVGPPMPSNRRPLAARSRMTARQSRLTAPQSRPMPSQSRPMRSRSLVAAGMGVGLDFGLGIGAGPLAVAALGVGVGVEALRMAATGVPGLTPDNKILDFGQEKQVGKRQQQKRMQERKPKRMKRLRILCRSPVRHRRRHQSQQKPHQQKPLQRYRFEWLTRPSAAAKAVVKRMGRRSGRKQGFLFRHSARGIPSGVRIRTCVYTRMGAVPLSPMCAGACAHGHVLPKWPLTMQASSCRTALAALAAAADM